MDFVIPNEVGYDFKDRISVSEAAKSILAQDRLFREALAVLQRVYPNLELQKIDVAVREVSHASPFRSVLVAYAVGVYSSEIGSDMPDILQTMTGGYVDVPDNVDALVSLIIVIMLICVLDKIRAKYFPDASEQLLALEKQRERLIEATANGAHVSQIAVTQSVEQVMSKRPGTIERASLDLLRPAKRHHAKALTVGHQRIESATIEALPSDAEMAMQEPQTQAEELERVIVRFRAHDLDKEKRWAATIDEVSQERLPLHLAPYIQKDGLFQRKEVLADVLTTYVRDDKGEYNPTLYLLTRVYDADAA